MMGRFAGVLAGALLACGGGTDEGSVGGGAGADGEGGQQTILQTGCPPGSLDVNGACLEAGLDPALCPPGEALLDGRCTPAGVPRGQCGEGFVSVDTGCSPILPTTTCPPGEMALPGETACRPVAPCGTGTWGDIPVEPNTVYVDAAAAAGGDGSIALPFDAIEPAIAAAEPDAIVAVAAGSYAPVTIQDKAVRLWGRCPSMVEIVGQGDVLTVGPGADGAEVRDLALTGAVSWAAVATHGSSQVLFDRLWLHDTNGSRGFDITESTFGPTSVTIRRSLLERTRGTAVMVWGSDATIEDSEIREVLTNVNGSSRGINVAITTNDTPSSATIRGCVVRDIINMGIAVFGSTATIERTAILDAAPPPVAAENVYHRALNIVGVQGQPADVTIDQTVVDHARGFGAVISDSTVTMNRTTVRSTVPDARGQFGHGVFAYGSGDPDLSQVDTTLDLSWSLLHDNHDFALAVVAATSSATGLRIRETTPSSDGSEWGWGMVVNPAEDVPGKAAEAELRGVVVEDAVGFGIVGSSATMSVESTAIRRVSGASAFSFDGMGLISQSTTLGVGYADIDGLLVEDVQTAGIYALGSPIVIHRSEVRNVDTYRERLGFGVLVFDPGGPVVLERLRVSDVHEMGVLVEGGAAELRGCVIDGVAPNDSGTFGDGLSARRLSARFATPAPDLTLERVWIGNTARAGISSFGGTMHLTSNALMCNPLDLNGEGDFSFVDAGENGCGCAGPLGPCKVLSTELTPPEAPDVDVAGPTDPPPEP